MPRRKTKMLTLLVLTFYLLGIFSALNAVTTARTAQGAVAWAVTLLTFPFVAVPAYWVFGASKFEGFVEAYRSNSSEIDSIVEETRDSLTPYSVQIEQHVPSFAAIQKMTGFSMVGDNSAELLINGEATFDSIVTGIGEARDYVLVQFYTVKDDELGQRLLGALIDRAQAGVRVYLIYDEIGSMGLPDSYVETLQAAGVLVSSFKPNQSNNNRFQINFRNHRKIVIVDGKTGWLGGHNVGDEYMGLDPRFTPWRDTHVKLSGPVVIQLQSVVASDWYWATRDLPTLEWSPQTEDAGDTMAVIIPSAPTQKLETAGLMYVMALNMARERIWLTAPYFVPDEAVMKALELAALRGVDVRIIVPSDSDSRLVYYASFHYISRLRNLGIKFYEYGPGFLHQKVALIDHQTSLVGTANFDNRSFRLNFEVTALIYDEDFAAQMENMLNADFDHATVLDVEELDDRGFWWQLRVSIARLASPIL
jgi:cardiolipin synthase